MDETRDETLAETEAEAEAEAEDGEKRDPATPVAAGEELSAEEIRERANHVVANPEERAAHDPVPADGQPV